MPQRHEHAVAETGVMEVDRTRVILGIGIALAGSLVALAFGGGSIGRCLGPLGVTAVRCAAHGGGLPTTGAMGAQLVVAWCAGLLCAVGPPGARWSAGGALGGATFGVACYLAARQPALEGPDFNGTWLSIPLPIEPWSVVSWAVAGGLAALTTLRMIVVLRHPR
jgi:hypothetical protein